MEGPEEEEEEVNVDVSTHLSFTCDLLNRLEEQSALKHLELNSLIFTFNVFVVCYNHTSVHHILNLSFQ